MGSRHMRSSHIAATVRARAPIEAMSAAQKVEMPEGTTIKGTTPTAMPAYRPHITAPAREAAA